MKIFNAAMLLLSVTTMLVACGGGGGGGTSTPPVQPTTATIKISTQGTYPSGALIGGVDVTLSLPAGVTVKATPDPMNSSVLVTNTGVVITSGVATVNSTTLATYSAATNLVTGTTHIKIVNPTGFSTGEFITVNCDIATGNNPKTADFSLSNFAAVDLNGTPLSALAASFVAAIQ